MADLKIMSMNCRGLAQQHKRRDTLNYLKNSSADIILLQETHISQRTIPFFDTLWPGKCYHSCKASNSGGTTILTKPSLPYDLIVEHSSEDGNFVLVVIKIKNNLLTIVNIYGPNDDTPSFYKRIDALLQQVPQENIIIGGDYNFVIDRVLDSNYQQENNIHARKTFINIAKKYNLVDIWRRTHPDDREYTWTRRHPLKYGRLDMFFASEHLLSHVYDATIQAGYRTDHSQIHLTLRSFSQQRGPGLWKFNESLLKDDEYSKLINSCIIDAVQQYAVPIYSKTFTSEPSNFSEVQLTIDVGLFYETLLMLVRGETVRYSKQKARRLREEEESANREIERLRHIFSQSGADSDLSNLSAAQSRLEKIREPKIQGTIARSRVRWHEEGEKCSKYFLSLEKRNGIRKSIQSLLINGKVITLKSEILTQLTAHLNSKYNAFADVRNPDEYIARNVTKKLNEFQKHQLDKPLTLAELSNALAAMKKGRSPGSNGFTADFFKHFWNYLGIFLFRTVEESIKSGTLPLSHRESIVTLIPKAGKPLNSPKDWRPISLLNVDFKIVSSAITNRLKTVIQDIISPSQSAYISGRFIGENSRLVYDVIDELNRQNRSGLILAADFEAAFESVSWPFLSRALDNYNFGAYYKYLIHLLYLNDNNFSRILLDGFLGDKIYMKRGIRQGDPASGYLFNLVVEPLANQIIHSTRICGIALTDSEEIRVSQYADDLIIFLENQSGSIDAAIHEVQVFSEISGLRLIIDKTKCLQIGTKGNTAQLNTYGIEHVEELRILGITFNKDNKDVTTSNILKKLPSIEREILQWKRRHLTIVGKITVIKALLVSKLVHIFTSLPNPAETVTRKIETIFYRFLWNDRNDRVKRSKLVQRTDIDGLNMVHLHGFMKSMKISWMERLYKSNHAWSLIVRRNIPFMEDLRTYGSKKLKEIIRTIQNQFWKEVLEAWTEFFEIYKPSSDQIITEKLWFSDRSKFDNSIIKRWDAKGIRYIADLISNTTGKLYSKNEIETIYGVKMTFLCYASLVKSLPDIVRKTSFKSKIVYPLIPYRVSLMHGREKLSRLAYKEFQSSIRLNYRKAQLRLEQKWNRDIGYFQLGTMEDVSSVTKSTYLQMFHFRVISRIIPTKKFLHVIGRSENNLCTFCSSSVETLFHMLWDCSHIKQFIAEIKITLSTQYNISYNISKENWFFPSLRKCPEWEILVTTLGKVTIYNAQCRLIPLSIDHFLNKLKLEVEKDLYIAKRNDNIDGFKVRWGNLKSVTK